MQSLTECSGVSFNGSKINLNSDVVAFSLYQKESNSLPYYFKVILKNNMVNQ